jgi:hypothetical protein
MAAHTKPEVTKLKQTEYRPGSMIVKTRTEEKGISTTKAYQMKYTEK